MAQAGKYVDFSNISRKVIAIAAGEAHTLALTGDGSVYSWGRGTLGRLGTGSELDRLFPVKIEFNSKQKSKRVKIVGVSAGAYHSLALSDDGSVWSWGHNTYGQLGINGEGSLVPSLVEVFHGLNTMTDGSMNKRETGLKISTVKAGVMMSLAIDDLGSLWMWGNCPPQDTLTEGEFSLVTTFTPTPVWDFHGHTVVKVACGSEHIVALVSAGETYKNGNLVCYTWGNNNHGQLGLGDTDIRTTPQMVEIFNTNSPWSAYEVACGAFHTCLLAYKKGDDDILKSVCWTFGLGENGQLGLGTTEKALHPEIVKELPKHVWLISVDCGLFHTSVISSAGNVWSWGMGNGLGLCPETTIAESESGDALMPRLITCNNDLYGQNFPEPLQVACGAAHTVLLADGGNKLWSWGRGRSGVLGNGQVNDFFTPNLVLWPPLDADFKEKGSESETLDNDIKRSVRTEAKKDSEKTTEIEKEPSAETAEMNLLRSKLSITERYAKILHGSIFGNSFDGDKDIPESLQNSDSFDVAKEWEKILESCDHGKLVNLEMFYRNMLAGVKHKIMKQRIKEMIKECLQSSPTSTTGN